MLFNLCRAGVEGMSDLSGSGNGRREMYRDLVASLLSLVLAILLIAFLGKYLWNTTVAELFTFARPVRSVWQIIGLMIFLSLIR